MKNINSNNKILDIKTWIKNKPQFVPTKYTLIKPFNNKRYTQVIRIKDNIVFYIDKYKSNIPGVKSIEIVDFLNDKIQVALILNYEDKSHIMIIPINEMYIHSSKGMSFSDNYTKKAQEVAMSF